MQTVCSVMLLLTLAADLVSTRSSSTQPEERASLLPQRDWRAVHLVAWGTAGGPEGLPPLKRAITEVLAPLGVNVIIYEVGYNFEFQSHPELRYQPHIDKAQARELAALCRQHGISLIPARPWPVWGRLSCHDIAWQRRKGYELPKV